MYALAGGLWQKNEFLFMADMLIAEKLLRSFQRLGFCLGFLFVD